VNLINCKHKTTVRLIHWNPIEAERRANELQSAGYTVIREIPKGPEFLRQLKTDPPGVLMIDLDRIPSAGRDIALGIRTARATRRIPLVFVGGDPEKVERIRDLLPDAVYSSWDGILASIELAIDSQPAEPVIPESVFDGYAGASLSKKLKIKADYRVALVGSPKNFKNTVGDLPERVRFTSSPTEDCNLTLWFVRSKKDLEAGIKKMTRLIEKGGLWIIWPKKIRGTKTDLSQVVVRKTGLASGLVDYKICSVDETWSGLLFSKRRKK
jgi:hypothetical protein